MFGLYELIHILADFLKSVCVAVITVSHDLEKMKALFYSGLFWSSFL